MIGSFTEVVSMGLYEPYSYAANRRMSLSYFNELVHDGWRSSLSVDPAGGYEPVLTADRVGNQVDIANMDIQELPPLQRRICTSSTARATAFFDKVIRTEGKVLDAETIAEGSYAIYRGWVHGKHGNVHGMYLTDMGLSPEDASRWLTVDALIESYPEVPEDVRTVDTRILDTVALGMTRPDVIPWVADTYFWSGALDVPGLEACAERGMEHIRRVVDVTGRLTPLKYLLISQTETE